MILRKTSAKASAPAKIILFGEHFVVYDNPAILASINRRVNVRVNLNKTQRLILHQTWELWRRIQIQNLT